MKTNKVLKIEKVIIEFSIEEVKLLRDIIGSLSGDDIINLYCLKEEHDDFVEIFYAELDLLLSEIKEERKCG